MSEINIVCVNEGVPSLKKKYDFIDQIFAFNKIANPEARFHYISNEPTTCPGVTNHDSKDYHSPTYHKFKESYVHLSDNPHDFELSCFLRWIILEKFLKSLSLESVLYLDNDVALYTPVESWPAEFFTSRYSLSLASSPHTNFINNPTTLSLFIDHLILFYGDHGNRHFRRLQDIRGRFIESGSLGGVSDMTLWSIFANQDHGEGMTESDATATAGSRANYIRDISQVFDNTCTFDHHLSHIGDYERTTVNREGHSVVQKNIKFINRIPYCFNENLQKDIKFHTVHFQGSAKSCLSNYLNYETGA